MPSYYDDDDSEDSSQSQNGTNGNGDDKSDKDDSEDQQTSLLPLSFFKNKGDLRVGDIEKIKIVHLYEDEAEVRCIYKDGKDKSDDKEDKKSDDESDDMKHSMNELEGSYA